MLSTKGYVVIGGDMNENISVDIGSQRTSAFRNFLQNNNFEHSMLYHLDTLEKFLRTSLKQILSLPTSTASPVVHILTGILPVEAMVHKTEDTCAVW